MSDWQYQPSREQIEATNVWRFMQRLGFSDREEFLRFSRDNPERFWSELAAEIGIEWFAPYRSVLDVSRGPEWAQWFTGGKLNIVHNALDRHAFGSRANQTAVVSETEDGAVRTLTFSELAAASDRVANGLRAIGIQQGDRIALVMPMVADAVIVLYAALRLGLVVVPIFAGFGAGAIASRLEDSGARVIFTADHLVRRGKQIPLSPKVQEAALKAPSVEHIFTSLDSFADTARCAAVPVDSESPALLLYTSGTTGKPKGCVHTHAGALVQVAKEIWLAFDHREGDRFFWLSDIGWMMGPWSIIGNHHFGGAVYLFDGAPDYPEADRVWQMLDRHRITTFGVSPTAIRMLMRSSHPEQFRLDDLRLLGSTGEPWDETSWLWFFEKVGRRRCPIINISGGTEIIGCFLFPLPIQPLKPCSLGSPAPGMSADVFDEAGRTVRGRTGYLVCTRPAPSMTRGIWNRPERYLETYWSRFPGVWFHGDWARVDDDGCWYILGRADESMNVAGRKVGPAEIEAALIEHAAVSEAAVIGVPDDVKGEAIVAFAVLKNQQQASEAELIAHVAHSMGAAFRPRAVVIVKELPKTQSGKIVRRFLRQTYLGEDTGDTSTIANAGDANLDVAPGG